MTVPSVRAFLASLGLELHADAFEANAIDVDTLRDLTDADLKELGVSALGHRKKILAAISALGSSAGVSQEFGTGGGPPPPVTPTPAAAWPNDLSPETLPTWLAHPWAALCAEPHPRVRLHWLVDTAELVVRWTVALALAEVVHAHGGRLPEAVADAIAEHVERPTLGRWLGILRALCGAAPAEPVVTRGLFAWASDVLPMHFVAEGEGGTPETSLLVLRNQVAHGGGLSRARAEALVEAQMPVLATLLRGVRDTLGVATLVADGQRLLGLQPQKASPDVLERLPADASGPWVVGDVVALPLEPLLHYGTVASVGADGQLHAREGRAAQLYARGSRDRLVYTPLGTEASHAERLDVAAFRDLFQLDRARSVGTRAPTDGGFAWDDFLREARQLAEDLIGRADELHHAKAWLKSRDPWGEGARVGWVSAGPGVGKSMLVARLAADYGAGAHRGLYYHRFRGGDARNDRRSFLRLLQAALLAWEPLAAVTEAPAEDAIDGKKLEDDVKARLEALATLEPANRRAPRPTFWVFVDGLDEVASADPRLPELLRDLAVPGTVWLVAGRPEGGLDAAFAHPGCEAVYAGGLPPMHAGDIRAMLLEGLGSGRYALLARDEDAGEDVRNAFVEGVVARAHGLPLYVHLLLEDLRAGHLDVRSEGRLPDGLTAYYDALVERLGISDAKRDLTQIVAILSRAMEPLDVAGLALLLAGGRPERVGRYLPRVEAALRAGAALLRRAPSPDTTDAWALYHQSFREYVGRASALAGSVSEAEEALVDAAAGWAAQTEAALAPVRAHLFRWGTEYALWWGGAEGVSAARGRLTDFAYLQARTGALAAKDCRDLAGEYAEVLAKLGGRAADGVFALWEAFFRERVHLLLRGDADWPSNRILLQLAVEHADDSPVTKAAEAWLETGACDWVWLRRGTGQRVEKAAPSACLRVLEGHTKSVNGATVLLDGRILSWSEDGTLRLWDGSTGAPLVTLEGHTKGVNGAMSLPDGRLLSWSRDGTLRLWDGSTGAPLVTFEEHTGGVNGVFLFPDGRLLSWSDDKTLGLWDGATGAALATLVGHTGSVQGALALPDGRLLSWAGDDFLTWDHTLRLWDGATGAALATLEGHTGRVLGALRLPDGRLLSWSFDETVRLWDGTTGAALASLEWNDVSVANAVVLSDGRCLSWNFDGKIILHDCATGAALAVMEGHSDYVSGVLSLSDGRLLSWSGDTTLRLWDSATGAAIATLVGHTEGVQGALALPDGRLLSWSTDSTVRLWDSVTGVELANFEGHRFAVNGAVSLFRGPILSWGTDRTLRVWDCLPDDVHRPTVAPRRAGRIYGTRFLHDGRLLSWHTDGLLQLWDGATGSVVATLEGHVKTVNGALELLDGRFLSWSWDGTLRLWDGTNGVAIATLEGHANTVSGAMVVSDGRYLSWSWDGTLRLWDGTTGAAVATLEGHSLIAVGCTQLPDSRILSWLADGTLRLWNANDGVLLATLRGHTSLVCGATSLRDGRLLSWSQDKSLRIWDSANGAALATLEGHTEAVHGAVTLPDGRLLSWSGDGTLRLWDAVSGAALFAVNQTGVEYVEPELHRAWRRALNSGAWQALASAAALNHHGGPHLWFYPPVGTTIPWHADGSWAARHLLPEGTLVATCDKHLAILHLHHGNRRVSIEEAEALLAGGST